MKGKDNILTIRIENNSVENGATASDFSTLILTGLGFYMDEVIESASITANGGLNFTENVDLFWGQSDKIFNPLPDVYPDFTTNVSLSTLNAYVYAADGEAFIDTYHPTLTSSGGTIDGPPHGIIDTDGDDNPGPYPQPLFYDWIEIELTLASAPSDWNTLIGNVNSGDVVVAFGSPVSVPEPANMLLLGTGLLGFAFVGRKKFKK
jgi:hypothetical protein